jgi:hypothetical protein
MYVCMYVCNVRTYFIQNVTFYSVFAILAIDLLHIQVYCSKANRTTDIILNKAGNYFHFVRYSPSQKLFQI